MREVEGCSEANIEFKLTPEEEEKLMSLVTDIDSPNKGFHSIIKNENILSLIPNIMRYGLIPRYQKEFDDRGNLDLRETINRMKSRTFGGAISFDYTGDDKSNRYDKDDIYIASSPWWNIGYWRRSGSEEEMVVGVMFDSKEYVDGDRGRLVHGHDEIETNLRIPPRDFLGYVFRIGRKETEEEIQSDIENFNSITPFTYHDYVSMQREEHHLFVSLMDQYIYKIPESERPKFRERQEILKEQLDGMSPQARQIADRLAQRVNRDGKIDPNGPVYIEDTDPKVLEQNAQVIAKTMTEAIKGYRSLLRPIYDVHGNLWWPHHMSYEEVKQFVAERDTQESQEPPSLNGREEAI